MNRRKYAIMLIAIIIIPTKTSFAQFHAFPVPFLYFNFDESSGDVVHNLGSLSQIASCDINGAIWTEGHSGYSLQFDGIDDFVDCGYVPELDLGSDMSLLVWVRVLGETNNVYSQVVVGRWLNDGMPSVDQNNARGTFALEIFPRKADIDGTRSGYTSWMLYTNNEIYSSEYVIEEEWTHIAVTISEESSKFFLNGVLTDFNEHNLGKSVIMESDAPLYFGAHDIIDQWDDLNPFNGEIDEIRIYDRELEEDVIVSILSDHSNTFVPLDNPPIPLDTPVLLVLIILSIIIALVTRKPKKK